jgi:predicted Fe-Mo cluster-binding NifX family protein
MNAKSVENKTQKPCRVAVSSKGDSIDSEVSSIGQSTHFIIFEGGPDKFRAVVNEAMGQGSDAGIRAANFLRSKDITIVITGTLGQRGFQAFKKAGVTVHAGCSGKVKESIQKCLKGELPECKGATYSGDSNF